MGKYKVRLSPEARQDLLDIADYVNTLSPEAAIRYYDEIIREILSLDEMPARYPRPHDLALAVKGYRYLVVRDYLVFYVISQDRVLVRRILYGKRNYTDLL